MVSIVIIRYLKITIVNCCNSVSKYNSRIYPHFARILYVYDARCFILCVVCSYIHCQNYSSFEHKFSKNLMIIILVETCSALVMRKII
jgi:hypothetical protein